MAPVGDGCALPCRVPPRDLIPFSPGSWTAVSKVCAPRRSLLPNPQPQGVHYFLGKWDSRPLLIFMYVMYSITHSYE